MATEVFVAHAGVPKMEIDFWDRALKGGKIDLEKEKLAPLSCVFVKSVELGDGCSADIKVCTDTTESGGIWSEMAIYDPSGSEVWLSDVGDRLSGTWTAELDGKRYEVHVEQPWFEKIGTSEKNFKRLLREELVSGVSAEYVGKIVDAIAERVAEDVAECADPEAWNSCDVSLGAGRVILKALGVEV